MDSPILLIALFFGGGILFMIAFVVIMVITGKGKPGKPSQHADTSNGAADAMRHISNSDNF